MKQEKVGEIFILSGAIIWSFFPILTVLSYKTVPSIISLAVSTFISIFFFLFIVIYKKKFYELRNPLLWKYVLGIVFFIGILFYVFFYLGLTKTTPGNASLIGLFEICTSYIFFNIIRKEHFSLESKAGSILMVLGAIVVLAPNFSSVNWGDMFILLAIFFPPIGNLFQQKAKLIASAESIMFLRSLLATPFLFLIAYFFGQHLEIYQIKESAIFLILNGLLLFGLSKIFWLEGIGRLSVTKSNALSSISPLFTLFFAWILLHQSPTLWQIASVIPFFFGILLLTRNLKLPSTVESI